LALILAVLGKREKMAIGKLEMDSMKGFGEKK